MKRKEMFSRGFKIASILVIQLFVLTFFASAYNLEEYYPLDEGNTWFYNVTTDDAMFEMSLAVEGKETVDGQETVKLNDSRGGYKCLAFISGALYEYKDSDVFASTVYTPAKKLLPNIGLGETEDYTSVAVDYDQQGNKTGQIQESGKISMKEAEDINVPAGNFPGCLKFSSEVKTTEENGSYEEENCDIWYAQGVGKVKQFCFNTAYDAASGKATVFSKTFTLTSALINGKEISNK